MSELTNQAEGKRSIHRLWVGGLPAIPSDWEGDPPGPETPRRVEKSEVFREVESLVAVTGGELLCSHLGGGEPPLGLLLA